MQIFVPIQEKTFTGVQKRLREIRRAKADGAELWLDHLDTPLVCRNDSINLRQIRGARGVEFLAVCKKPIEKGHFKGTYAQMADILIWATTWANYIDIPIRMPKNIIKKIIRSKANRYPLPATRSKIILSYHNFHSTPSSSYLLKKAHSMRALGAQIVKIACQAHSIEDTLRIIFLAKRLQKEGIHHILIAMGKYGTLGRIITPLYGGTLMFAPLTRKRSTAPGQLTVAKLHVLSLPIKGG